MDTARELRNNRETRREMDTGGERKDTVRGSPRSWGMTVTDRAQGPALAFPPSTPSSYKCLPGGFPEGILTRPEGNCRKHPLYRRPPLPPQQALAGYKPKVEPH